MTFFVFFKNLYIDTDHQKSITYELIGGDEVVYVPYTLTSLQQYLDEGRIDGETQIRVSGMEDWMPLNRILTLTAATPTEYEPSAAGGAADINAMDALKEGWAILQKIWGFLLECFLWADCWWHYQFNYWASILGRTDGRGNVYIFVKSDPR